MSTGQMLTVRVPLAVRKQRGWRKLVLTPGGMQGAIASAEAFLYAASVMLLLRRSARCG